MGLLTNLHTYVEFWSEETVQIECKSAFERPCSQCFIFFERKYIYCYRGLFQDLDKEVVNVYVNFCVMEGSEAGLLKENVTKQVGKKVCSLRCATRFSAVFLLLLIVWRVSVLQYDFIDPVKKKALLLLRNPVGKTK